MIGLELKVKNVANNIIIKIINGIYFAKYTQKINTDQFVYYENGEMKDTLLGSNILSGVEFYKYIIKEKYYIIFVDIKSYKDFLESSCELVFLCIDSKNIVVLSKDSGILTKIRYNCIKNDFETVTKHYTVVYLSTANRDMMVTAEKIRYRT